MRCFSEGFLESSGSVFSPLREESSSPGHSRQRQWWLFAPSTHNPEPPRARTRSGGALAASAPQEGNVTTQVWQQLQPKAKACFPTFPKSSRRPVPAQSPLLRSRFFQLDLSLDRTRNGWKVIDRVSQGDAAQPKIWAQVTSGWQSSAQHWRNAA